MLVEIWSDVVCPWCYIGKRRFEAALAEFAHRGEVEIRWRSFQLDPTAARSGPDDEPGVVRHLADKYGVGIAQAEQMVARVDAAAAQEGLAFAQDQCRGAATLDAHRLIHAAAEAGGALADAVNERLLRGYFVEGQRIDDHATLTRLATEAGMDAARVAQVLAGREFADAVRADHAEAAAIGATGVPFFVVDRRVAVSGAQPVEVFTRLLEQGWSERQPVLIGTDDAATDDAATGDAHACGPDGCTV